MQKIAHEAVENATKAWNIKFFIVFTICFLKGSKCALLIKVQTKNVSRSYTLFEFSLLSSQCHSSVFIFFPVEMT